MKNSRLNGKSTLPSGRAPAAMPERPERCFHLPHAEPHQRCCLGLSESLLAYPAYQFPAIDLFRGHRHCFLRHESTLEHAPRVSKGTFLLGPKGTFELGRYKPMSDKPHCGNYVKSSPLPSCRSDEQSGQHERKPSLAHEQALCFFQLHDEIVEAVAVRRKPGVWQ